MKLSRFNIFNSIKQYWNILHMCTASNRMWTCLFILWCLLRNDVSFPEYYYYIQRQQVEQKSSAELDPMSLVQIQNISKQMLPACWMPVKANILFLQSFARQSRAFDLLARFTKYIWTRLLNTTFKELAPRLIFVRTNGWTWLAQPDHDPVAFYSACKVVCKLGPDVHDHSATLTTPPHCFQA